MESPRGLKDPSLGALAAVIPDADLIVLAGKCLDFTLGFGGAAALGGQARVVVIDPDAAMLERAQRLLGERLALAVQGDAIAALSALRAQPLAARAAWRARVDEALRYRGKPEPATSAARRWDRASCARRCRRFWRPRRIRGGLRWRRVRAVGAGLLQRAGAHHQRHVGAIGAGLCYAIAAKIARPGATVLVLMGMARRVFT